MDRQPRIELLVLVLALLPVACGDEKSAPDTFEENLSIAVCDPSAGGFTTTIDNPYFPLAVGTVLNLEGEEDGAPVTVRLTVLDEVVTVAGVDTRVIEEYETEDGELAEVSRNFFVQASDGSVCYYGEEVDEYEDGAIVGHGGAWRVGENGAIPGIVMPASPAVGQSFRQEVAEGVAEDRAVLTQIGETLTTPAGTFTDTIRFLESSPLDSGTSDKVYARDVGLVFDDYASLASYTLGGTQ